MAEFVGHAGVVVRVPVVAQLKSSGSNSVEEGLVEVALVHKLQIRISDSDGYQTPGVRRPCDRGCTAEATRGAFVEASTLNVMFIWSRRSLDDIT